MKDLSGKTALVTGGARGIGLAICRSLLDAGMTVVVADQDQDALDAALAQLGDPAQASAVTLDVRSGEAWRATVDEVWERFGGIDVLCNNAGMGVAVPAGATPKRSWELDEAKIRQVLDVNLMGTWLGMQAVVPHMIERGTPAHIVNTASMASHLAPPYLSAYSTSKFAVAALSECAAAELIGHEIGITILCPGGVATAFNESAREFGGGSGRRPVGPAGADAQKMNPVAVGERVVKAILAEELYVFTHPEYLDLVTQRQDAVRAAFTDSAQPGYRDPQDLLDRSRTPLFVSAAPSW
jgi:NAD(P)-dependent dehydrogenase (short-subunit alcohol dehydrogenase family)